MTKEAADPPPPCLEIFSSTETREEPVKESVVHDPALRDPYNEPAPALEPETTYPAGSDTIANTDKRNESVFVTLGRYAFPREKESSLPEISLQTIYNKTKYLVIRWSEPSGHFLSVDERQFFDSLFSRDIDSIQMLDWEHLREIFIGRDDWFAMQRQGRNFRAYRVTVKELPSWVELLKHLPACRSLARAKADIKKYISVVNLGRRADLSDAMGNTRSSRLLYEDDDVEATASVKSTESGERRRLRRSARLIERAQSMADVLIKYADILDEEYHFDSFEIDGQMDSGFDEPLTEPETSIFELGEPELQLGGHFHYPAKEITLEEELTDVAFADLDFQLRTYYNLRPRTKHINYSSSGSTRNSKIHSTDESTKIKKRKSNSSAHGSTETKAKNSKSNSSAYGSTKTKIFTYSTDERGPTKRIKLMKTRRMRRPSLPQRSSARLASRDSRRSSDASSSDSESAQIEIISAEKAILTALKVPEEHGQFPSDSFLKEHGDKFIREYQVVLSYDSDVPQSVESPMTLEQSTLSSSPYKTTEYNGGACLKEFCVMGCICESIQGGEIVREHCRKVKCQLECVCSVKPVNVGVVGQEIADIRSRLRPRVIKKWSSARRRINARKRNLAMGNTESSRPELVKPIRGGGSDCGDSYMGDIDMASNDDDCSRGSFSCPPSPGSGPVALVTLTSDEDDDVEMGIPSELEEEDRIAMERAKRRAALQMKVRHCQPCLVRTVEADLNLPLYQIETLCAPRINFAEDEGKNVVRRLYKPLPLNIVEQDEERTICGVDIGESHYLLIDWQENCDTPRVSRTSASPSPLWKTLLTLPIPPVNQTFVLFRTPTNKDGDIILHIDDMEFLFSLDQLHDARVEGRNKSTRRVQLVDQDQQLVCASTGHPCELYLFPSLPTILVFGPLPVISNEGTPCPRESCTVANIMSTTTPVISLTARQAPVEMEKKVTSDDWNGTGDLIPRDYYQNVFNDLMIEFPEMEDSSTDEFC